MSEHGRDVFSGRDVRWLLDVQASSRPGAEALVWRPLLGDRRAWTYHDVQVEVDQLASGLGALGVGVGVRVVIHLENRPEFILAWLATQTLGAVMVTTNTKTAVKELSDQIARSGAQVIITEAQHLDLVLRSITVVGVETVVVTVDEARDVGTPRSSTGSGAVVAFSTLYKASGPPDRCRPDSWRDAGIQYTSGTTARPKGVVWSHSNYLWAAKVSASHEQLTATDRHLTYLPLFHTNAQSYSVMASLWAGATVVLMPRFSASQFWDIAVDEQCTWSSMIPFAVRALSSQSVPPRHSFRAWGLPVTHPRWSQRFGVTVTGWWGMTETISHPIVSEPHLPSPGQSMGVPAPEYDVRLVDNDGDVVVGVGTGLLEVRGTPGVSLMSRYLDDPAATREAYSSDGWLMTGDRVKRDEGGNLTFVDRAKDVLKVGGENVAASEVERVVRLVDGVEDVAVIGGRHPMLDEVPVAFVVPSADAVDLEKAVEAACADNLAPFKVPAAVLVVESLPRTTLEKVAKQSLRDQANAAVAAIVSRSQSGPSRRHDGSTGVET